MGNIGWIGLGNMGTPMSERLIKAGHRLWVYNRTKEKENELRNSGATAAGSPLKLALATDVIFIMVSDDEAVRQIFHGPEGLASAQVRNKIIINMSTVSPGINREMALLCSHNKNEFLDAPVSGSVKQAQDGQLVIMVGGSLQTFDKVKPLFEGLGKLAIRLGDVGAGSNAKLAINSLLAIFAQGLAEAVLLAEKHDIKKEDFFALINNGALGNAFAKIKGEAILRNDFKPAFALKHIVKDLHLAKAEGLRTPLGCQTYTSFEKAKNAYGEKDIIAILEALREVN